MWQKKFYSETGKKARQMSDVRTFLDISSAPAPRPPPERDLGRSPNGVCGEAPTGVWGRAPSYILAANPFWGLGWSPNSLRTSKPKPTGLVSPQGAKFV